MQRHIWHASSKCFMKKLGLVENCCHFPTYSSCSIWGKLKQKLDMRFSFITFMLGWNLHLTTVFMSGSFTFWLGRFSFIILIETWFLMFDKKFLLLSKSLMLSSTKVMLLETTVFDNRGFITIPYYHVIFSSQDSQKCFFVLSNYFCFPQFCF